MPLLSEWNRKLHFYTGLYFLLFLWLFSVTGLLLNHSNWRFHQYWPQRKQTTSQHQIQLPTQKTDLEKAQDLMQQLRISGEVEWPATPPAPGRFDFRVAKPGQTLEIKTNLAAGQATVERTQVNGWGVLTTLHTFSGVRVNDPKAQRDWLATKVWSFSMDAVAVGLLFMVCSSYYMWYRLKAKRLWGWVVLGLGTLSCGFFVAGLRWLNRW